MHGTFFPKYGKNRPSSSGWGMMAYQELPHVITIFIGLFLYAIVFFLLTYPLLFYFTSAVISHWSNDIEHSLWIQWWFAKAIDSPHISLFHSQMISFPSTVNMHFANINLAINVPFYLLNKIAGLQSVYNLMLLFSFVLAASLMWWFTYRICGHLEAAWAIGLIYAASPYWLSCMLNGWCYLVHIWIFPLVFLIFQCANNSQKFTDYMLAGGAWGLAFHVSPYYFIYINVLLVVFFPWYLRSFMPLRKHRKKVLLLAVTIVTMLLIILPRGFPMYTGAQEEYVVHHDPLSTELAARPAEIFLPSAASVSSRVPRTGYLVVFLSYTVSGIIVFGWLLSSQRRVYRKWVYTGCLMFFLALGPLLELQIHGQHLTITLPYRYLLLLPGFRFMTNHWRWSLPGIFCLEVAVAIGLRDIVNSVRQNRFSSKILVYIFLGTYLVEIFFIFPFPQKKPLLDVSPDPIATVLRKYQEVKTVFDPRLRHHIKINQMEHEKAIIGGWLPRIESDAVETNLQLLDNLAALNDVAKRIEFLGEMGVDAIILDSDRALIIEPEAGEPGKFTTRIIHADSHEDLSLDE